MKDNVLRNGILMGVFIFILVLVIDFLWTIGKSRGSAELFAIICEAKGGVQLYERGNGPVCVDPQGIIHLNRKERK